MGCQKLNLTNIEEKIKPVYQSTIIQRRIVWIPVPQKFQRLRKASIEVRLNNNYSYTRNNWDLEKRYTKENTFSSSILVGSIDQGATRFGGYSSVHAKMGAPLFLKLYLLMNYFDANSEELSGLLSNWVQYIKDELF